MPQYSYAARDSYGELRKGTIQAADERAAGEALRQQGYYITELMPSRDIGVYFKGLSMQLRPVSLMEIATFARQFATMINAGLSLVASLRILEQQAENKQLKQALGMVATSVTRGETLARSLRQHPKVFPSIVSDLVQSGEVSGNLDTVLDRLASHLEREYLLVEKVRSAMYYPIVIFAVMIIGFNFLNFYVMPNFVILFASFEHELPAITKMMIWFSGITRKYFLIFALITLALIYAGVRYYRMEEGRRRVELLMFRLPIVGQLFLKREVARFALTLSTLMRSGVPIIAALQVTEKTCGNSLIAEAIASAQASVRQGGGIARPLQSSNIFPPMVSQMIAVGEETGRVDELLEKVGEFYTADATRLAERLTSLIEPALIIIMGIAVAVIVVSIYLPLFEMMEFS